MASGETQTRRWIDRFAMLVVFEQLSWLSCKKFMFMIISLNTAPSFTVVVALLLTFELYRRSLRPSCPSRWSRIWVTIRFRLQLIAGIRWSDYRQSWRRAWSRWDSSCSARLDRWKYVPMRVSILEVHLVAISIGCLKDHSSRLLPYGPRRLWQSYRT